ncbi:hypothetical protein MnTg03_01533 [bacterium MnTg03]|nr:hypothetical protein MnTg03_01533 [bacterium MnTg03]
MRMDLIGGIPPLRLEKGDDTGVDNGVLREFQRYRIIGPMSIFMRNSITSIEYKHQIFAIPSV